MNPLVLLALGLGAWLLLSKRERTPEDDLAFAAAQDPKKLMGVAVFIKGENARFTIIVADAVEATLEPDRGDTKITIDTPKLINMLRRGFAKIA